MFLSKSIQLEKTILYLMQNISRSATGGLLADRKQYTTQTVSKLKLKPRPPFILFSTENLQSIRQKNPDLPLMQLSKILGQMWRDLPQTEKDRYKSQYIEQKKVNDIEKKIYFDKLSKDEKQNFLEEQGEIKRKIRLKRIKALQKKFNMPKRSGVNPYILFLKSKFLERGDAPFLDYAKGLKDYWIKMTEEDKEPFVIKARENAVKYKRQISEWDQRMIATGHKSLVSKSRLSSLLLNKPFITTRPKRKTTSVAVKAKNEAKSSKILMDNKPVEKKNLKRPEKNLKTDGNVAIKADQKVHIIEALKSLENTIKEEFGESDSGKVKLQVQKGSKKK